MDALDAAGVAHDTFAPGGEPSTQDVADGTAQAHAAGCDLIIGFGGGSALDAAKAIAALATNGGAPLDYVEVVGQGRTITRPSLPCIAIPTTAGTGTEVTANAVLLASGHGIKASIRSAWMIPTFALIDPDLTLSLPPAITASTGLDALTQLIEPFVSNRATPLTDGICREGLACAARALRRAYQDGSDRAAREDMSLAALMSGLGVANAGLGSVHGFAGLLGGRYHAPHGTLCGCLLPHAMLVNIQALEARAPGSDTLRRFAEVARILTGDPNASPRDGAAWAGALCESLATPTLASMGIPEADFPELVETVRATSSMKKNPITLTDDELRQILERAL